MFADGLGAQVEEPEDLAEVWEHLQREQGEEAFQAELEMDCLLYTSPSPRDRG